MNSVACQSASNRQDLFSEAAARLGLTPTILEKDFWVCWMLKQLFAFRGNSPSLIFKGGTSLSKVYSAIRRFSEDIDLSFDRKAFGYDGERDPETASSGKRREKLIAELVADVEKFIATDFLRQLGDTIATQLGRPADAGWDLSIDVGKADAIVFRYPPSLSTGAYGATTYLNPAVRLELGARGDAWPTQRRSLQPYAADMFPKAFREPTTEVVVLEAERTFWEKATILHMEYHRAEPRFDRLSRHYYDLAMLADTEYGRRALAQPNLLERVAKHKSMYFASGWAKYNEARPGSLRLAPSQERKVALAADYAKMAPMFFDQPPPRFDDLIGRVEVLERQINAG